MPCRLRQSLMSTWQRQRLQLRFATCHVAGCVGSYSCALCSTSTCMSTDYILLLLQCTVGAGLCIKRARPRQEERWHWWRGVCQRTCATGERERKYCCCAVVHCIVRVFRYAIRSIWERFEVDSRALKDSLRSLIANCAKPRRMRIALECTS